MSAERPDAAAAGDDPGDRAPEALPTIGAAPGPTAAAGYSACEVAVRRRAANFGLGIRLLPASRRKALSAVYWFASRADDAVDSGGPVEARRADLAALRDAARRARAGAPDDARWAALADAVARYDVPPGLLDDLLDGVARDLDPARYETWEDLRAYCWGVACTVGLISLRIFGGEGPDAERDAEELGYALQLTNILRDLREDARRGRWYLPLEETGAFGIEPLEVAEGRAGPGFEALLALQADRARGYYAAGPRLVRRLPRESRACPAALAGVYRGLLERIAAEPRGVLRGRVRLPTPTKAVRGLGAAARAWIAS